MEAGKAKELFGIKKGETPKTRFIDNLNAVDVKLIDWPDPTRLETVLVNMAHASWFKDYFEEGGDDEVTQVIDELVDGKILAQGLEHAKFCFVVSGLSLHGTHALVRNRIGICYMQRSLAVSDLRHEDILVPRAFTKRPDLLARYKQWCKDGKQLYADLLDTEDIANTDARFTLPKTIPSWCYVSCTLPTLLSIYGKRNDTQEEHPEMNRMVHQMRSLVAGKFPYMNTYFKSNCTKGTCLHQQAGYTANCIFKRDFRHKIPGSVGNDWTLHDKTKQELMLDCEAYPDDD